jgi:cytochrome c
MTDSMGRGRSVRRHFLNLGYAVAATVVGGAQADPAFAAGDPVRGANVYKRCSACHSVTEDAHSVGPSLRTVANRKMASVSGYKFSPALSGL